MVTKYKMRYLYIIGSTDPPYKVGISVNPAKRLRALQTGYPLPLQIHYQVATEYNRCKLLETALHRNLQSFRCNGEWFNLELDKLKLEVDYILIRYEDDQTLQTRLKNNLL